MKSKPAGRGLPWVGRWLAALAGTQPELEAVRTSLETRTRDLALAAEAGQRIAVVRDLDRLLAEAVELVQARFDLYYAQIYLMDAAGHSLVLRAGTGPVGTELARRGHRLPVGPGSINGTAAAERRTLIVAETKASPLFLPNPLLPETCSEMAIPLIVGERVVGVLDLQSSRPGLLTADSLPAFEALAGQLAIAIENAALFAEAERARTELEAQAQRLDLRVQERTAELARANEALRAEIVERQRTEAALAQRTAEIQRRLLSQTLLYECTQDLAQAHDVRTAIADVTERMVRWLDATAMCYYTYDEAHDTITTAYEYWTARASEPERQSALGETLPLSDYPRLATAIRTRTSQTLRRNDPGLSQTERDMLMQYDGQTVVAVPLAVPDRVVGYFEIWDSRAEREYDEADVGLLLAFAGQAALAIEKIRLFEETRRRASELTALFEAGRELRGAENVEAMLPIIVDKAVEVAGADCGSLWLLAEGGDLLVCRYATGVRQSLVGTCVPLGQGITGRVAQTGTPHLSPGLQRDPRLALDAGALAGPAEIASDVCVPLRVGEEVVGALHVSRYAARLFSEAEVRLATAIADMAASAIRRSQLLEAVEAHAARLEKAYRGLQENQDKLLITEKMASLGRLTAGIAHEMNTPLAAVRAALAELDKLIQEYQSSTGDPEVSLDDHRAIAQEMQQAVQLANNAAERAAGFVRSIKAQTRDLEAPVHERFNAVPVIQETLLLLGHALRRGNCMATLTHATDYVELLGSPGRLAQVVTNLVLNAIDASAGREGSVINLRLNAHPDHVELQVHDVGRGMPPENLPRIFDPLFTTKPFGEGVGLGLTVVHQIVTGEFGGTIAVTSQPGQGTSVTVHFPAPDSQEMQHAT